MSQSDLINIIGAVQWFGLITSALGRRHYHRATTTERVGSICSDTMCAHSIPTMHTVKFSCLYQDGFKKTCDTLVVVYNHSPCCCLSTCTYQCRVELICRKPNCAIQWSQIGMRYIALARLSLHTEVMQSHSSTVECDRHKHKATKQPQDQLGMLHAWLVKITLTTAYLCL